MNIATIENQKCSVGEDVVRRVITSFGFPTDRVERAVACLLAIDSQREMDIDRVLSVKEVQHCLGISKSGLRRVMAARELVPIDITKRRIGFSARDLTAFIDARKRRDPRDLKVEANSETGSPDALTFPKTNRMMRPLSA